MAKRRIGEVKSWRKRVLDEQRFGKGEVWRIKGLDEVMFMVGVAGDSWYLEQFHPTLSF